MYYSSEIFSKPLLYHFTYHKKWLFKVYIYISEEITFHFLMIFLIMAISHLIFPRKDNLIIRNINYALHLNGYPNHDG